MSPGILTEAISSIVPSTKQDASQSKSQHSFPSEANTEAYALKLDAQEPLTKFRSKFIVPTKTSLRSTTLTVPDQSASQSEQSTYFCGNSLGLQPKCTREYINAQLDTWSAVGVHGHFTQLDATPLKPWQNMSEYTSAQSAKIVGADPSEVVIMNSLTANLHLAMSSFYRPQGRRNKIVLEWKAFPSDHYAIESQIRWHGLDPEECMVLLSPDEDHIISTAKIERVIDELQDEIALVLLPGLQYYTGQVFDMPRITKFAHDRGLTIGWDLAHAAGNVELKLNEWDVDFAVWCTYKYMNAGPGAIAGMYVNERHGKVVTGADGTPSFRPRLMGWYGGDRQSRFKMDNKFNPIPGAAGFQLSNPSAIDLASLAASLSIFEETSMSALRQKSLHLTAYLQHLLLSTDPTTTSTPETNTKRQFRIITPLDPAQRGAQLSVLLEPGLLKNVAAALKDAGIVADQREPDVVRVAPVPLYNTFWDVWYFVKVFKEAIATASASQAST